MPCGAKHNQIGNKESYQFYSNLSLENNVIGANVPLDPEAGEMEVMKQIEKVWQT